MHPPDYIAERFLPARKLTENDPLCWLEYDEGSSIHRVCVVNYDRRRSGNFYRLAGAISSLGLKIRSADINLLLGPIMFFAMQFEDTENREGELSQWRQKEICEKVIDTISGKLTGPPRFRKKWGQSESKALQLSRPEINVKTNNSSVNHATIIDVFAYDKPGLLYQISKKIYRLGLDVTGARVSTYAHQIIDVFYVTDEDGNKIRNQNQLQIIRKQLLQAVTEFLEADDGDPVKSAETTPEHTS